MLATIINYLDTLLEAIEHRVIGSVEGHLQPLKDIVTKLEATKIKAATAAAQAHADAIALNNRAQGHTETANAAAKAAEKIAGLFN